MQKLLLVLALIAMASFLFVGCLGEGTVADTDTDTDTDTDVVEQAATITVAGEYYDAAKGLTYVQAASKLVTVEFTLPIAAEFGVKIQGDSATVKAGSDRKIWTKLVDFSATPYVECVEECIVVTVGHPCCPDDADTYWKLVVPDGTKPCASFVVTFKDCAIQCPPDDYVPGASMSWTTLCGEVCDEPLTCCGDDCSGVGVWTFTEDYDICGSCDVETDSGCDITGAFECGCLSYTDATADPALTGIHEVLVSIKDNVGNEFTDTWTITFDTDNVTTLTFKSDELGPITGTYDATEKEYTVKVDYDCTWTDCATCFPEPQ